MSPNHTLWYKRYPDISEFEILGVDCIPVTQRDPGQFSISQNVGHKSTAIRRCSILTIHFILKIIKIHISFLMLYSIPRTFKVIPMDMAGRSVFNALLLFYEDNKWGTYRAQKFLSLSWLVGCFGHKGPLRQYFSLYRAVSQREGRKNREMIDKRKNVQTAPTRTYCKHSKPLLYSNPN